jgi:hypothetical protein
LSEFAKYCQLLLPKARKDKKNIPHCFNSSNKMNLKIRFCFLLSFYQEIKEGEILAAFPVTTANYCDT